MPPTWTMLITKSAPVKRRPPVEGGEDVQVPAEAGAHLVGGPPGDGEPFRTHVVQHHPQLWQIVEAEEVGEQLAGEDDAARTQEDDGGPRGRHGLILHLPAAAAGGCQW